MVRTQIQLTEEQAASLKRIASEANKSVAALIRECVDSYVRASAAMDEAERDRRALALVGLFNSGLGDLGEEHDKYFVEAVMGE